MDFFLRGLSSLFVILILIVQGDKKYQKQPTVTVQGTEILGINMITRNNRTISAFIGIPYAEPPIGALRFSNPVFKELPKGYLMANKEGSACPHFANYSVGDLLGEEDCLFLNIFTPWKSHNAMTPLLPVMVHIHGSAYQATSSEIAILGPGYLLDKDIIYVSFNYRLNILGFFSTGDDVVLGNFGLKDQLIVLQWIHKYIRFFGGDPNQVTLVGYSSGADCIFYHSFSNITKRYFHRYIAQGGSPYSTRSFREGKWHKKVAKSVAKLFNCPSIDSQLLVDCLRNIDYKTLINNTSIFSDLGILFKSTWSPTIEPKVDGAYITENPFDLLKQKKVRDLPGIGGVNKDEGLVWIATLYFDSNLYNKIVENFDEFIIDTLTYFEVTKNVSIVASEIKSFYFKNEVFKDKNVMLKQLADFTGDLFKVFPQIVSSVRHVQITKSPFYMYLFNYRGLISLTNKYTHNNMNIGVIHADELIYLYPRKHIVPVQFNEAIIKKDSIIIDMMVDLWTSFIINGKPTSDKLTDGFDSWKPYLPGSNILEIGNFSGTKTQIVHSIFNERLDFWKHLQPYMLQNFL